MQRTALHFLLHIPTGITSYSPPPTLPPSFSFSSSPTNYQGTAVAQWLRYCATNRKVAGSIPDGVIGIFH